MRIISQDKMRDLNYDTAFLRINGNIIEAIHSDGLCSVLGAYSSKRKALKVMDMIREAHVGKSQKILVTEEEGKIEEVINMNYYFYMPKDDDVK